MKEYKTGVDELKHFKNLIEQGYEIYEMNIHRGITEIKLQHKDIQPIETIIFVAI